MELKNVQREVALTKGCSFIQREKKVLITSKSIKVQPEIELTRPCILNRKESTC